MSGLVGADILLRRVLLCPPRVPDTGRQNTFYVAKSLFHSPETTCTERSFLSLHANTMKRLDHVRNQMLAAIRGLSSLHRSQFHGT